MQRAACSWKGACRAALCRRRTRPPCRLRNRLHWLAMPQAAHPLCYPTPLKPQEF